MRLFVGIDLPPEVRRRTGELLVRLRSAARLGWVSVENLHITTKFIGEWPEHRLGELETALRALPCRQPFQIRIAELGWFPNPGAPRTFWAGLKAGTGLSELARETHDAVARLGVAGERRTFSPHLTLARIRERKPLDGLLAAIEALPSREFGEFTADRSCLFRSELRPGGSVYTKLAEYAFLKS
jgi:2'-5' RNA ligase